VNHPSVGKGRLQVGGGRLTVLGQFIIDLLLHRLGEILVERPVGHTAVVEELFLQAGGDLDGRAVLEQAVFERAATLTDPGLGQGTREDDGGYEG
jgi:hypothetical protein